MGALSAQVSSLSPYSRFALGELSPWGTTAQRSMGGITSVSADPFSVNGANPASYSFLFRTAYNLDIRATGLYIDDGSQKVGLYGGGLSSAQFGFKKQGSKWGYGLGLRPFSSSGYDLSVTTEDADVGEVSYSYNGDGGISLAHAGLSRLIPIKGYKGLLQGDSAKQDTSTYRHQISIGANVDYYFGKLTSIRRVNYAASGFYDTRINTSTALGSITGTLGIITTWNLGKTYKGKETISKTDLVIGGTYNPQRDFLARYSELNESVFTTSLGTEFVADTALYIPESDGVMTMPARLTAGASLTHTDAKSRLWILSADLHMQDWSAFATDFDFLSEVTTLQAYQQLSVGLELTPRPIFETEGAFLRSSYRFGFRMADSYITVRDHSISEWAASSGISIPITNSKSSSKFHFGMEVGSRGTTSNALIQETFVHAFAGFSFSPTRGNNWFVKRKYD